MTITFSNTFEMSSLLKTNIENCGLMSVYVTILCFDFQVYTYEFKLFNNYCNRKQMDLLSITKHGAFPKFYM